MPQPAAAAYDKIEFANEGRLAVPMLMPRPSRVESSRVATARLSSVACVFSLALDAKRQSEISQ